MPIVEPPVAGCPLSQGDILRGITLHATKQSWNENGGDGATSPFKLCLVVSRQCVITNKKHITVVGVEKYPEDTPREIDDFDKVLDFMKSARDGVASPDVFYLGQLPGLAGRYCARLDSFHDIEIPPPTDEAARAALTAARRVAALNPDFIRALHSRLFGAFASMGFDDFAWASSEDLRWIVVQGQADIAKKDGEVKQQQALKLSREAENKRFDEKQLTAAVTALAALREKVAPYEAELAKREQRMALPSRDGTSADQMADVKLGEARAAEGSGG